MIRQIFVLALFSSILFSCGGDSGKSGGNNDGGKKIFRYNQTGGLTSLDPAFANKRSNIWGVFQVYNGLFRFEKGADDIHLHPELAKSWQISDDGLTYTFTIRKGVFFHNNKAFKNGRGRELVADDFVYSFKRLLDAKTKSPGAWIFNDKLLRNKEGKISDTSIKIVDHQTFKIYLEKKFPAFLNILAMPYCYVVPQEAVEKYGEDFGINPVGTGPFQLTNAKDWQIGNSLTLYRNPRYWKKDADHVHTLPHLDAIQISFNEDPDQAFLGFKEGEYDFVTSISPASKDEVLNKNGSIKKDFEDKYNVKIEKIDYLNTEYIGFYMGNKVKDNPYKDNKKLRQALSYAIDRKKLVSILRNGLGNPGIHGMVPKALPSFDTTVKGYSYNVTKARELLKDAGFPGGEGLPKLTLYTHTRDKDIAGFLQKQWKDIGINVSIIENLFSQHQSMVDNGKVAMFRGSWLGDYPDAENYLAMFYGGNFSPAGPNKTNFKNEEFDQHFVEVHELKDIFKKYDHYRKMDQIVMDNAPVIVLYYDEVLQLLQKKVKGLEVDQMNNLFLENVDFK